MQMNSNATGMKAAISHVKWGRAILAGMAANIASFFVGGGGYVLAGRHFTSESTLILPLSPATFFEMSLGWWTYLIMGNTVLAICVGIAYAILYHGIPGRGVRKGLAFGFIWWVIGILPVTFTIDVLTFINGAAILYITIQALIESLTYGAIIAVIYGEALRSNP